MADWLYDWIKLVLNGQTCKNKIMYRLLSSLAICTRAINQFNFICVVTVEFYMCRDLWITRMHW